MQTIAIDLETFLIQPGLVAPPVVCMSWHDGVNGAVVSRDDAYELLRVWLADPNVELVAHNIGFEFAALLAQYAPLRAPLFLALKAGRLRCTQARQQLLDIKAGTFVIRPRPLDDLAVTYGVTPVPDKSDPWRLRYGTLAGVPIHMWAPQAYNYSLVDAQATIGIYQAQGDVSPDEHRQTEAAVFLALAGCWGMATDREAAQKLVDDTQAQLNKDAALLLQHGLLRPDGTKNKKAAEERLKEAYKALGKPVPRGKMTAKMEEAGYKHGNVKLDDTACMESEDDVLKAYTNHTQGLSLLGKAKRLLKSPIQPHWNVLVASGRTSCSMGEDPDAGMPWTTYGFQLQNPPKAPGVRECLIARPGKVLVSIDWDTCELRTLAQACIDLGFGSEMAKVLADPNRDVHVELGAGFVGLTAAEVYTLKKTDKARYKDIRQYGKLANFGFPGGLRAKQMVDYAKTVYGVIVTLQQAEKLEAAWHKTWPEMRKYLDYVKQMAAGPNGCSIAQLRSGRVRGRCYFTDGANTYFQGLAADLSKAALVAVGYASYADPSSPIYGARLVCFVHDELILEIDEARAHEIGFAIRDIMLQAAQPWVPDVPMRAEPALMRRWSKAASDPVFLDGRLVPYEDWASIQKAG